ncbi:hypothetical protein BVY04_03930 [bacterium M21]|nr:hypothetical protein BVY04_03930 [bacterium M21]
MINCMTWQEPSYKMVAMDDFLMFVFDKAPEEEARSITLGGGTLSPGDRINGMFGPLTSAQYCDFHPIQPGHFVYNGMFCELWREIVLCTCPGKERHEDKYLRYGWVWPGIKDENYPLFTYLRSAGTIRTIQTNYLFLNEAMPPDECIEDKYYWKKKAAEVVA